LASTRPTEQSALVELGAAGKMPAVNGDFLGVVTQNAGGNKIDWFLRRATSARVRIDPATGRVDSTVQVRLTNQAPATGLPPYIIGSVVTPPLPNGTNKLYLSVYSPWLLAGASIDGQPALLESELELGRHVYSTFVSIPPGGTVTVELRLTGRLDSGARSYGLTVFRPAAVEPDGMQVAVETPERWEVCAAGTTVCGSPVSSAWSLDRDRRLDYRLRPLRR